MGRYIALEGSDGSGKSTVAKALAARLEAAGHEVVRVREPGGTPVGESIRELLLESEVLDEWAEVFLFAAQRAELARGVLDPALQESKWVVSDRSYYSSIAYQGRARGLGEEEVRAINERGLAGTVPDRVFVLDVDPADALERQDRTDRIGREGVEFQKAVLEAYRHLAEAEPQRVRLLPGHLSVEEMVDLILEDVE